MSDPTAPRPKTLSVRQAALSSVPVAYDVQQGPALMARVKTLKNVDTSKTFFSRLRMARAPTFEVDWTALSPKAQNDFRGSHIMHLPHGPGQPPRVRSGLGVELVRGVRDSWRDSCRLTLSEIDEKLENSIRIMDAPAVLCTGRLMKHFPRKGDVQLYAPTQARCTAIMGMLGMDASRVPAIHKHALPLSGDDGITISSNSSNGLPTLGNSNDPDDMERCLAYAKSLAMDIDAAYAVGGGEGVRALWRDLVEKKPTLSTDLLRCKSEVTTIEKYTDMTMRAYVCRPRALNMVEATVVQALKKATRHINEDFESHLAMGITFAHGGAATYVAHLDEQLARDNQAWAVQGDDSHVVTRNGDAIDMFALDVSSMDLNIRREQLAPATWAFSAELAKFNPARGAFKREAHLYRRIVLPKTLNRYLQDGNPSGATGVSEINSILMGDLVDEVLLVLRQKGRWTEPELAAIISTAGERRGWRVKLEQYRHSATANTVQEMLEEEPFLFLGYYLHARSFYSRKVCAFLDPSRWLCSVMYPPSNVRARNEMQVLESVRLAGIVMNLGVPPVEWAPLANSARAYTMQALVAVRNDDKLQAFIEDAMRWNENPFMGIDMPSTLVGVYDALVQDPSVLWLNPLPPPMLPPASDDDWAAPDEEEALYESREPRAGPAYTGPARKVTKREVTAKPVTEQNDGRPASRTVPKEPKEKAFRQHEFTGETGALLVALQESDDEDVNISAAENSDEEGPGWDEHHFSEEATQDEWEAQSSQVSRSLAERLAALRR